MIQFQIVLVSPPGYAHIECLRDVADGLCFALRELGHGAEISVNTFVPRRTHILLGAHLLTDAMLAEVPEGSILYNLEQLGAASCSVAFFQACAVHQVWDYSELNLQRWERESLPRKPLLLRPGFVEGLQRIDAAPRQDIDVLFYGSWHPRRTAVLAALEARGLCVHSAFDVYGAERDALIARARVVINIHYYETQIFESVRVSYLLNNGKAVVTEWSPDLPLEIAACLEVAPYDELAERTVALLANDARRSALETGGLQCFRTQPLRSALAEVLQATLAAEQGRIQSGAGDWPRRLNLGSGKDWREDCLNIDINDSWRPDAVLDLGRPQPESIALQTARFGVIWLTGGCLDEVIANDVLEHIPDLVQAMTAILRLLRVGGIFRIHVPYDLSWGAWQDPTHVRAFNERSWLYYTEWFWYMGWTEARFTVQSIDFRLSTVGETLRGTLSGEDLVRIPRAVDSMQVTLAKIPLSDAEKALVHSYLRRPERSAKPAILETSAV